MSDDPSAWLGDPIGAHHTGASSIYVNVPPAEREHVVISLVRAPLLEGQGDATCFMRVGLAGARGLRESLDAAISQLEEHTTGG